MSMTNDDKEQITEWIREKIGQPRCTMCGNGRWTLMDLATISIGVDTHSTRFLYHQGIPHVAIACTDCGHMVFFNAGIIGLKPDIPEEEIVPKDDAQSVEE